MHSAEWHAAVDELIDLARRARPLTDKLSCDAEDEDVIDEICGLASDIASALLRIDVASVREDKPVPMSRSEARQVVQAAQKLSGRSEADPFE